MIAELKARGWTPPEGSFLDYGCGTGVAGRRVAGAWHGQARELLLWDRSQAAMDFSRERAEARGISARLFAGGDSPELIVISHVLNELSEAALESLLAVVMKAKAVLWVEPGTAQVSRMLVGVRERLLAESALFVPVAPCPHAMACGLNTPENQRHWCHHFAKVPPLVFQDPGWSKFSNLLEVDLRTVPLSYLVLDRRPGMPQQSGLARVIGHPRSYKGYHKVLSCMADGVQERLLQRRDAPELFKAIKKSPGSLYQWEMVKGKVSGGTQIF